MKNVPALATSQTRNNFPNNDHTSVTEANNLSAGYPRSRSQSFTIFADSREIVLAIYCISQPNTSSSVSHKKLFKPTTVEYPSPTVRQFNENGQTPAKLTT